MQAMTDTKRAPWRLVLWGGAMSLLALPWVAMRFTSEVDWSPFDFAVFGAMLALACGAVELAMRASSAWSYRLGALAGIGTGFLLLWANLAVGVIGDEDNPANLLYAGVLGLAIVGSLVARLRARGMAIVMTLTAVAQGAVAAMATWEPVCAGLGITCDDDWAVLPVTLAFMAMWLVSAGLFAFAARTR